MLDLVDICLDCSWYITLELKFVIQVLSFAVILGHLVDFIEAFLKVDVFSSWSKFVFINIINLLEVFNSELNFLDFTFTVVDKIRTLASGELLELVELLVCSSGVFIKLLHELLCHLGHLTFGFHNLLV